MSRHIPNEELERDQWKVHEELPAPPKPLPTSLRISDEERERARAELRKARAALERTA